MAAFKDQEKQDLIWATRTRKNVSERDKHLRSIYDLILECRETKGIIARTDAAERLSDAFLEYVKKLYALPEEGMFPKLVDQVLAEIAALDPIRSMQTAASLLHHAEVHSSSISQYDQAQAYEYDQFHFYLDVFKTEKGDLKAAYMEKLEMLKDVREKLLVEIIDKPYAEIKEHLANPELTMRLISKVYNLEERPEARKILVDAMKHMIDYGLAERPKSIEGSILNTIFYGGAHKKDDPMHEAIMDKWRELSAVAIAESKEGAFKTEIKAYSSFYASPPAIGGFQEKDKKHLHVYGLEKTWPLLKKHIKTDPVFCIEHLLNAVVPSIIMYDLKKTASIKEVVSLAEKHLSELECDDTKFSMYAQIAFTTSSRHYKNKRMFGKSLREILKATPTQIQKRPLWVLNAMGFIISRSDEKRADALKNYEEALDVIAARDLEEAIQVTMKAIAGPLKEYSLNERMLPVYELNSRKMAEFVRKQAQDKRKISGCFNNAVHVIEQVNDFVPVHHFPELTLNAADIVLELAPEVRKSDVNLAFNGLNLALPFIRDDEPKNKAKQMCEEMNDEQTIEISPAAFMDRLGMSAE